MIFNRRLLQLMGFKKEKQVLIEASDTSDVLEEEVQQGVAALSTMHIDSVEYNRSTESIKNLCEAIEHHDKMRVERKKVELQIAEAERRRSVDWGQMTPKIISILAYAAITCVFIVLERQTPLSMRWVKALDALLTPKL